MGEDPGDLRLARASQLSTAGIWGQVILGCGAVLCTVGLAATLLFDCDNKCLQTLPSIPEGQTVPS